jgi:serine/threonine protein kinase
MFCVHRDMMVVWGVTQVALSQGLIHKDIKLENLYVFSISSTGRPLVHVGDFGSCGYKGACNLERTMSYTAPEVAMLVLRSGEDVFDAQSAGYYSSVVPLVVTDKVGCSMLVLRGCVAPQVCLL